MGKIKSKLYIATFFLATLSAACALINTGKQREFFYLAVYLSIVGLLFECKKIKFNKFNIAYPIIAFALLKLIWYFLFQYKSDGFNFYSDQLNGGKKLLLGGILIYYLNFFSAYYPLTIPRKKWSLFIIGTGFIIASCYGVWQEHSGIERVQMGINRATISAYLYSTLSFILIYLLYLQKKIWAYVAAAATIIISYILITFTGTRSAILFHLVIILAMSGYFFKKIHLKPLAITTLFIAAAFSLSYKSYIKPKIDQTMMEVSFYQEGKDNTSLGARFSMWIVGIHNMMKSPFGQSMQSRNDVSKAFTLQHPQYKSSMRFINIHLHNELIETLSLQGVPGGIVLLFLYLSILWQACKKQITPLIFIMISMIIYGLSDVLYLSSEATLFYIVVIAIFSLPEQKKEMLQISSSSLKKK